MLRLLVHEIDLQSELFCFNCSPFVVLPNTDGQAALPKMSDTSWPVCSAHRHLFPQSTI